MGNAIVGIVLLTLALVSKIDCTNFCRTLFPIDIRLCDIEGDWYWTLVTQEKHHPDPPKDCSGFLGQIKSYNRGLFTATGRKGLNPTLEATVINRQLVLTSTTPDLCPGTFAYKAAIVEPNVICFYVCGLKDEYDYAQCFTRGQAISEAERERIYNGLRYFGLLLRRSDLKIIDRSGCGSMGQG